MKTQVVSIGRVVLRLVALFVVVSEMVPAARAANYWFDRNQGSEGYGVADASSYDWLGSSDWNTSSNGSAGAYTTWVDGSGGGLVGAGTGTSYTVTLGSGDDQTVTVGGFLGLNWNFVDGSALGAGDVMIGGTSGSGKLLLGANTHVGTAAGRLTINSDVDLSNRALGFGSISGALVSDVVINGQITGTGIVDWFSYSTGGTLILSNTSNTYSGRTAPLYIGYKTVAVTKLADGGEPSSIGSSSANIGITGGTLKFIGTGAQSTDLGFQIGSAGAFVEASGATTNDTIRFSGAPTYSSANASRLLTLSGTNVGANTIAFVYNDNGSGANTLTKSGSGTWVLGATNTYSGGTTIDGGMLRVPNPQGMGNGQTVYVKDSILELLADSSATFGPTNGAAGYRLFGRASIEGNSTIHIDRLSGTNENNVITVDRIDYVDTRNYTWNITGANGYSLAVGTVRVPAARYTKFNPTTAKVAINAVVGSAYTNSSDYSHVVLDGTNTGNSITGVISDGPNGKALKLTKSNDSTWTLQGDNLYTGTTSVNGGTLFVNGTHTGGGTYTVATNATLGGIGNIACPITLNSGATLAPGDIDGYGVLTVSNDVSVLSNRTFAVTVGDPRQSQFGQLRAGSGVTVSLGGTLAIDDSEGNGYGTVTIINVSERGGMRTGSFSNLPNDGDSILGTRGKWRIRYGGGAGGTGDVTLTLSPKGMVLIVR